MTEYEQMISDWLDETKPVADTLRSCFAETGEGELKYLLTIHAMMMQFCLSRGIPVESFHLVVPSLLASWVTAGKPEHFDYGAILIRRGTDERREG